MSIYNALYNLINEYIFGNAIVAGSPEELATTLLSLAGCIFVFSLPFVVVWKLITVWF